MSHWLFSLHLSLSLSLFHIFSDFLYLICFSIFLFYFSCLWKLRWLIGVIGDAVCVEDVFMMGRLGLMALGPWGVRWNGARWGELLRWVAHYCVWSSLYQVFWVWGVKRWEYKEETNIQKSWLGEPHKCVQFYYRSAIGNYCLLFKISSELIPKNAIQTWVLEQ